MIGNSACFSGSGGVQWCTQEYLRTLKAAGFDVTVVPYEAPRALTSRIKRKIHPRPYHEGMSAMVLDQVSAWADGTETHWLFLNNTCALEFARLVPKAKRKNLRTIFLSHGALITDELNSSRTKPGAKTSNRLGKILVAEAEIRRELDGAVCISYEDLVFEKWLGTSRACFVPRSVIWNPLPKLTLAGRVGTVSTLDHVPNLEGIHALAEALDKNGKLRFRLVGGPDHIGRKLESEHVSIDYCGRLSDQELAIEAATWAAFVNPVFCQARGASTKVATALGWGLPVLTTHQGARGYRWDHEALPLSDTPDELASHAIQVASLDSNDSWVNRAKVVSSLAPSTEESGTILGKFLMQLQ